ncbi:MAG: biotin--[acetyl-CoA-carboxylase] ligase [Elusimicrobia bacterium]|nr:biotin--[acetyl-CoA-carboxylase] ligase [Elusimicrobiota bacterium]
MNKINEFSIKEYLQKKNRNIDFQIFDTIDSTNIYAKKIVKNLTKNTIIISNSQTNGQGKFGRTFYSPANTGLYMTIVLKENIETLKVFSITFLCALAVCKTIEKLTEIKPKIKWINDIFINDKKCCGILTECVTNFKTNVSTDIIAGIGININTVKFPKDLKDIAISLQKNNINKNQMTAEIINNFFKFYNNLSIKQIIEKYKKYCFVLGKDIYYTKENIKHIAKAIDINDFGNLIIKDINGNLQTLEYEEIKIL